MLKIRYSTQFKKDFKLAKRRGLPLDELKAVIEILASGKQLASRFQDHSLSGRYNMFRECHIRPDWLLIYRINMDTVELIVQRTGTHSDLFKTM